jgi:serine/threonine-protein kinase
MEWLHFVRKGMMKDPSQRFQSVGEMIARVQSILDGEIQVQCHVTLIKRTNNEVMHSVDRHPILMAAAVFAAAGLSIAGGISLLSAILHAF